MKEDTKNLGGRPTKLTEQWLEIAEEVLNEEGNSLLTDEELVFLINDKVTDDKARITDRTFQNWKAKAKKDKELDKVGERFFRLLKKALIKEKNNLIKEIRKGEPQWQSKAWIAERKFDEWNIKHKTEHSGNLKVEGVEIKIKK